MVDQLTDLIWEKELIKVMIGQRDADFLVMRRDERTFHKIQAPVWDFQIMVNGQVMVKRRWTWKTSQDFLSLSRDPEINTDGDEIKVGA